MNCNCLAVTNGQLAAKNLELCTAWQLQPFRTHYQIHTQFRDKSKRKRGEKPTPVLATFCPFCGTKLHNDDTPRSITSGNPLPNEKEKA